VLIRSTATFALGLVLAAASAASAQSRASREPLRFSGGVTWLSLWDDETFLGRGPLLQGGVALPLGASTWLEGELFGGTHHRDAGYLAADGTPVGVTGRVSYRFRGAGASTRPYVSGGWTVLHSTGELTTRSIVPDDRGLPVEGPITRRPWSLTRPAFELGAGLSFASSRRVAVRPEFRWSMTSTDPGSRTVLGLPLTMMRAGVTVEWSSRAGK
jgi:opacity protein-like surface antigen